MSILEKVASTGVVPVVVLESADDAVPLAKALIDGGLPCAEVTFRTAAAEESIRRMTEAYPDMFVGAGTILSIEQVDKAVAAGSQFIVTPGFDPEVVDYCLEKNIPVFPGCVTPTEITQAVKRGLKLIKFFPASSFGGVGTINLEEYLTCKHIVACGGSWMVKGDLIKAGDFQKIEELTREAVELVKEIRSKQ